MPLEYNKEQDATKSLHQLFRECYYHTLFATGERINMGKPLSEIFIFTTEIVSVAAFDRTNYIRAMHRPPENNITRIEERNAIVQTKLEKYFKGKPDTRILTTEAATSIATRYSSVL